MSGNDGRRAPDCERWAFSDHGPWLLESDSLVWRTDIDGLRERTRREVPRLVARRRMPPLWRFADAGALVGAALLYWWLGARRRGGTESRADLSRRLRSVFERLGPTYIKLAQIVSSGTGLFPDELVLEFKHLSSASRRRHGSAAVSAPSASAAGEARSS